MVTTKTRHGKALRECHTHTLEQKQRMASAAVSLIEDGHAIIHYTVTTVLGTGGAVESKAQLDR